MRAVLKTNDPVQLNFAQAILADAGIQSFVFDSEMSGMEGSMTFIPRRLMVPDEEFVRAVGLLDDGVEGYTRP
jgi:hypothetical protein